ncbi:MAG: hypothetical protein RL885_12955 [Planctomycetota bacterium]
MPIRFLSPLLLLALAAASTAAFPTEDQQDIPKTLEEQLAVALERNPQVRLAEAKVRQAEAELTEVRLRITEEIIQLQSDLAGQQLEIEVAKESLLRSEQLVKSGHASSETASQDKIRLLKAEGELTRLQARQRYLLGVDRASARRSATSEVSQDAPKRPRRPGMPAELQKRLDMKIPKVNFEDRAVTDCFLYLSDLGGFSIVIDYDEITSEIGDPDIDIKMNIQLDQSTIGGILQAIVDLNPPLVFVARDYGLLATTRFKAEGMFSATIPAIPMIPEEEPRIR